MDLSYILNHLGEERASYFNAVSPPVMQTSNFSFPDVEQMRRALRDEMDTPFYTRGCNPTVAILRKKLAALEGTEDALVFGSGCAAISAAVLSCLHAGSHAICVRSPYSWTNKLFMHYLPRFGVETTMVDGRETANFEKAIRPETKLIYLESPNSMTFELQDIAAVAALARKRQIKTIIDNSYCSPLFQQPASMGIDIVVHTITKYLGGHSDVVAGVVCSDRKTIHTIFENEFMTLGGIISPHDAWLVIRSLRTLPLRMERIAASTAKVTAWLEQHPAVEEVRWPFASRYPQRDLAQKQMKNAGGLFSILLKARSPQDVERVVNRLKRFQLACSWGGHESLVFPVVALTTSENYSELSYPWNLVRFYIGLEDPDWLIEDLDNALQGLME